MISEAIKKQREKTFSECRQLLLKINGDIQEKSQESAPTDDDLVQIPEDSGRTYNICDCCQRSNIPDGEMTRIESGQRLCPECLSNFYEAAQDTSDQSC